MAEVFLEHYLGEWIGKNVGGGKCPEIYGDVQTFRTTEVKETVGEEVRILLPSRRVAVEWEK